MNNMGGTDDEIKGPFIQIVPEMCIRDSHHSEEASDNAEQGRTGDSSCDRSGMEPWKDGYDRRTLRIYGQRREGKTYQFRVIALIADRIRLEYKNR